MRCFRKLIWIGLVLILISGFSAYPRATRAADPVDYSLGGYADQISVVQGGQIAFHIATDVSPFDLTIVNAAQPDQTLATIPQLTSQAQDCTGHYTDGCGWLVTTTYTIPNNWSSGYYTAQFMTSKGPRYIIFIVRPAHPGSTSPIVVIATTNTYQAYNAFGGKSVYDFNSTEQKRAAQVSFDRPFDDNNGLGRFPFWEKPFITWMQAQSRLFEVISDSDLQDASVLSHYKVAVIVGHSEYWTLDARQHLIDFSNSGGHIAIFGGNTMWFQARYENNARTLVVYKDATQDPEKDTNPSLVSVNWFDDPVFNPENLITGASFRYGGYSNKDPDESVYVSSDTNRVGYTVVDSNNWLLKGLNLKVGDSFGSASAGLEVDGVIYNCDNTGNPLAPDGADGTPLNYHILAITPGSFGHGSIGYYVNKGGGMVFNAGTRDWPLGLGSDPVITQITTRLLDQLSTGKPQTYDPVSSPYLTKDTFNCQEPDGRLVGWRGDIGGASLSTQCAYEGSTGLELTNSTPVALARNFSPTGVFVPSLHVQMMINADNIKWPDSNATIFTLLTFQNRKGGKTNRFLQVQMRVTPTDNMLRLVQYDTNAKSSWVTLHPGWRSVQVGWESPGTITLQVDKESPATLQNTSADQGVNEFVITFPATDTTSSGYLCIDTIAASRTAITR